MAYAMENLGWKFYLINASWNVVLALIIYFHFPETKKLKLEEIAVLFEGPKLIEAALEQTAAVDANARSPVKNDLSVKTDSV